MIGSGVLAVADSVATSIRASAILTATYVATSVLDVSGMREVVLLISASAGAASNVVSILPFLAPDNTSTVPVSTDDVWYSPLAWDGSQTNQVIAAGATMLSGSDMSKVPEWGTIIARPMEIRLETTDNATDEIRLAVPIRCEWARYLCCHCADVGSGTLTTLAISAIRSA